MVTELMSSARSGLLTVPPLDAWRRMSDASEPFGISTSPDGPITSWATCALYVWPTRPVFESMASLVWMAISVPAGSTTPLALRELELYWAAAIDGAAAASPSKSNNTRICFTMKPLLACKFFFESYDRECWRSSSQSVKEGMNGGIRRSQGVGDFA